ncbi:MAG: bifunctional 5,10-methylene-tetrahydrofolate dehydrogenase/5,10-methylene-tetrahydrofolate cyclohydrolase [Candidatus Eisenbacteria bacterium]|nr:bifunctional 5,10-methylene-tetrahydrofolate dehydrogenase/5,10-methylene-tetrahydrofolate cyclohydrolase [Candidatus Latescibacterota bacterium]MBD3302978.1 bifunctional 5,10-methylene-tetrahydrofolate dehydrogenase/5,10-methylene-tetrahydrofolate cyclohydrolase [Candidatus Eisenbacteria bacterium]
MARKLDGKWAAKEIRRELRGRVDTLVEHGVRPKLSLIRVGEDPASVVYVRTKERASAKVGIESEVLVLPEDATEARIAEEIDRRVADTAVHGLLLQLPLPGGLDPTPLLYRIDPAKDVDGFHPFNIGMLCLGEPTFVPCTPLGILELLARHGVEVEGRHVAIVGRSTTVGRPLANLLSLKRPGGDAAVSIVHSRTASPERITREADLVVAAAGRRGLVTAEWIAPGAAVVDVGIHRTEDGSLHGDVEAASVGEVAGWLSPVPGGVGPMTVACLLANTVRAAEEQNRKKG